MILSNIIVFYFKLEGVLCRGINYISGVIYKYVVYILLWVFLNVESWGVCLV